MNNKMCGVSLRTCMNLTSQQRSAKPYFPSNHNAPPGYQYRSMSQRFLSCCGIKLSIFCSACFIAR